MPVILIVDPHPVVRHGIACLLREQLEFVTCIEAECAGGALKVVRENALDLIILEPDLPGADGLRLVKELRARQPRAPILAFTGLIADEFVERVLRAGAAGCLCKESPVSGLAGMVDCLLTHPAAQGKRPPPWHLHAPAGPPGGGEIPAPTPPSQTVSSRSLGYWPRGTRRQRSAASSRSAPRPSTPTAVTSTRSSA